jgi:hypothetical protein
VGVQINDPKDDLPDNDWDEEEQLEQRLSGTPSVQSASEIFIVCAGGMVGAWLKSLLTDYNTRGWQGVLAFAVFVF